MITARVRDSVHRLRHLAGHPTIVVAEVSHQPLDGNCRRRDLRLELGIAKLDPCPPPFAKFKKRSIVFMFI